MRKGARAPAEPGVWDQLSQGPPPSSWQVAPPTLGLRLPGCDAEGAPHANNTAAEAKLEEPGARSGDGTQENPDFGPCGAASRASAHGA